MTEPPSSSKLEEQRVFAAVARSMLGEDTPLPSLGRYEVRRRLGSGGMGEVYAAFDPRDEREVALKILVPAREADRVAAQRMLKEARALTRLRHDNVVEVYEVGEDEGRPYISMELLSGETLGDRLERGSLGSDTLPIVRDVASGVLAAHAHSIVHRDLKPANIFVTLEGRAKVLDFGVAKGLSSATLGGSTASGTVLGTPYYMSPEQARDSTKVDHRADLWALAVITYECVVGRRPFDANNLAELSVQILTQAPPVPSQHAQVPAGFDAWFSRATARDPDARFADAGAFAAALARVLDPQSQQPPRRAPSVTGRLAIGVGVLIAAVLAAAWWLTR